MIRCVQVDRVPSSLKGGSRNSKEVRVAVQVALFHSRQEFF